MKRDYIFLFITGAIFLSLAVVFLFFPRSTFSQLERRELKTPPDFSLASLLDGSYMAEVSSWFSDSQPFRDEFMTLSMTIKKGMALTRGSGEDAFVFHQTGDIGADMIPGGTGEDSAGEPADPAAAIPEGDRDIPEGNIGAADGEESKMSKSGILIVGRFPLCGKSLCGHGQRICLPDARCQDIFHGGSYRDGILLPRRSPQTSRAV